MVMIQCYNFMVHSNHALLLEPSVNFIEGPNGSGKSAMMIALQLCFGARASVTHRALNLDDLVKSGTEG